jgi:hypothetical protein
MKKELPAFLLALFAFLLAFFLLLLAPLPAMAAIDLRADSSDEHNYGSYL